MLEKALSNLRGALALAVITVNTIGWFTPLMVFTLLKFLVPVAGFRRLMTRWIMAMGENWVSCNAFVFGVVNDTRWDVRGLETLSRDAWYLVVANHQSWTDIVILQTVFNRRIPFLKFFLKHQLIWFPVLGLAFWALDMPFMKRYPKSYLQKHPEKKGADLEATRRACRKFRDTPTSVINFLEGTRFTEAKRDRRNSPYTHLLPPRAGGVAMAIASMGEMFDAIVDVTIVYPDGVPRFWQMMCGGLTHVVVDVTARPIEPFLLGGDYAGDRDFRHRFHQWLGTLWREKDERLACIRAETGGA